MGERFLKLPSDAKIRETARAKIEKFLEKSNILHTGMPINFVFWMYENHTNIVQKVLTQLERNIPWRDGAKFYFCEIWCASGNGPGWETKTQ